jgi:hypothetical protein
MNTHEDWLISTHNPLVECSSHSRPTIYSEARYLIHSGLCLLDFVFLRLVRLPCVTHSAPASGLARKFIDI